MEYGHFENGGREFVITSRKTPRHWHNYMYNDEYVAFFSQVGFGEGFAQDGLGRRIPLVKDRMLYVVNRETGAWSSANGLPMRDAFDAYECRHGLGYTVLTAVKDGVRTELTFFVPEEGRRELWRVRAVNEGAKPGAAFADSLRRHRRRRFLPPAGLQHRLRQFRRGARRGVGAFLSGV